MTFIYGHRGARGEAPENTLAGFELCLELGVRRCELDLHLSRDGELVVIHDPTLKRTTGRGGKVSEKAVADLVALDARQGGPVWPRPSPIPTLRELFALSADALKVAVAEIAPKGRKNLAMEMWLTDPTSAWAGPSANKANRGGAR